MTVKTIGFVMQQLNYLKIFTLFWSTAYVCCIAGCALDVQNKAGEHPLLTAVIYHSEFQVILR